MKYDAYRYLWPPRPEAKVPPGIIRYYQRKGWAAQVKKNGTCTVIFSHGDEVIFKTRHDDDHKLWTPQESHSIFFRGRPEWNVYVAELLHSKTPHIKNHLYLFDVLVADGKELTGCTFEERALFLKVRFGGNGDAGLGAIRLSDDVSRASTYYGDFDAVWELLRREDEGLVFKNPKGKLLPCTTATANGAWQVKCRKATENYSF